MRGGPLAPQNRSMITDRLRKAGLLWSGSGALVPSGEPPPERRAEQRIRVNTPGLLHRSGEDASTPYERVLLCNMSEQGLGVRLPEPRAMHQTEWLDIGGLTHVKGVVRHCRPEQEGYLAGLRIVREERRRNDRSPVCGDSRLTWSTRATKVTIPATVRNATALGLQVQVRTPVPLTVLASVTGESTQCLGSVCYCAPNSDGYAVGMHLTRPAYPRDSPDYHG